LAIDFPNSPTLNQDYTVGTTTWTYDGAKWVLKTYNSLHAVPVTAMMLWANTTYPTGWLLADGSAISRTTYADLFAAIGTTYGVGDGSTTFNLPSMPSAGTGSPNTIIKVTNSGALEPSAISHAANHTEGGSDVVTVTGNQISNYQSFRNLIINGGMSVAQRGTSTASITSGSYNTADRWYSAIVGLGTWTQSVENDAPTGSGFRKSLKMLCTTADASPSAADSCLIRQPLEGQDLQRIAKGTASANTLTLSFWVKANVTGTYIAAFYDNDNNRLCSKSYTVSVSGTWEKKSILFPADATGVFDNDNNGSLYVEFWLAGGSNFTSGTLQTTWASYVAANYAVGQTNLAAATSNYWQVTGVQLEAGSVATPFEFEPFETTLRKCQRYFQKSFAPETAPAQNISTNAPLYATSAAADGNYRTPVPFITEMRAIPTTITTYNGYAANSSWRIVGGGTNQAVTANADSSRTFHVYQNVTGNTLVGHWTASAEL
jgi:microcystin-dependent protein